MKHQKHFSPSNPQVDGVLHKPLLVDVDGVMLNYVAGFVEYFFIKFGRRLDPTGPSDYNMTAWMGVRDDQTCKAILSDFNNGDLGGFAKLPVYPGVKERILAAHSAGREVHVITSSSRRPASVEMRRQNLHEQVGPYFTSITCIDLHESKLPYLMEHPESVWLEDNYQNALLGVEAGHESYVIRSSHNRHFEGQHDQTHLVSWISSWTDLDLHI